MVNVSDCVNGPVWEILEVAVNGAPLTDLTGWRILENRYLSCPPTGWPQQSLSQQGCYWTVTLRHGATPPRGLLRLRDELFAEYLSNCGPAAASCNTDGITSISTKSGSYQFTETGSALDKICARYGVNSFSFAGFHDPGDPTKQYRILKLATGSTEQGQSDCEEWARGWATANPQTPAQAPTITNQKVYNKLGQPIG